MTFRKFNSLYKHYKNYYDFTLSKRTFRDLEEKAEESEEWIWETLEDYKQGIFEVNAIVFLSLKQTGRGIHFNQLPFPKFKKIGNQSEKPMGNT